MLADRDLFDRLVEIDRLHPGHPALPAIVGRCCAIKAQIVREDEQERAQSGGRALLNLGHTFGHAIENAAGYGEYLHGEAVAIGLVLAARLSAEQGRMDAPAVERTSALLQRYSLPTALRAPLKPERLMAAMQRDKKVQRGRLRFVLLDKIGQAVTAEGVPEKQVQALWESVQPG